VFGGCRKGSVYGIASVKRGGDNRIRFGVGIEPTHIVFRIHRINDLDRLSE